MQANVGFRYLDLGDYEQARELLRSAEEGLRRLDLAGEMVPSLDWFLYGFVRKEAVISSQIEGTQASLADPHDVDQARIGAAVLCALGVLAPMTAAGMAMKLTTGIMVSSNTTAPNPSASRRLLRSIAR